MYRTIFATSVAFAVVCSACPGAAPGDDAGPSSGDAGDDVDGGVLDSGIDDAGSDDAGPHDAGPTDGGSVDAGECADPAPIPTSACPPGCIFEERNIETQTQLEAFAAEEHPFPIDTVNIFSAPVGQVDEIVDISPLQGAVFTARAITVNGPSSVPDLVFPGIDVNSVLGFGGPGVRSIEFTRVIALFDMAHGFGPEIESLRLPNLRQAGNVNLASNPLLCDVDLGVTSAANLCDPTQRQFLLNGTCVDGVLQVRSCCAVPFE